MGRFGDLVFGSGLHGMVVIESFSGFNRGGFRNGGGSSDSVYGLSFRNRV